MTPGVSITAFIIYSIFVYITKRLLYPFDKELEPRPIAEWRRGEEHTLIISPDYWYAFRFKSRINGAMSDHGKKEVMKSYVQRNNKANLAISFALALACLVFVYQSDSSAFTWALLSAISVIRLVSRSWEIAYAFGCDVFQQRKSSTGLTKHERIRLALSSYFEIFLYSAAAYTSLPSVNSASEAVTLALNVGTLTNVGYAFLDADTPFFTNIVFVQVFATLSLVVLSLAAYLSRNESA